MEAVLLSIRPKWVEKIASGRKTIELRKTRPYLRFPFRCFIYCSKYKRNELMDAGVAEYKTGKVLGEFLCVGIDRYVTVGYDAKNKAYARVDTEGVMRPAEVDYAGLCMTRRELQEYGGGKVLYGWHIHDLKLYDMPLELCALHRKCEECGYVNARNGSCDAIIRRPPQSWRYVECIE